jgi:hypothetical protein
MLVDRSVTLGEELITVVEVTGGRGVQVGSGNVQNNNYVDPSGVPVPQAVGLAGAGRSTRR